MSGLPRALIHDLKLTREVAKTLGSLDKRET